VEEDASLLEAHYAPTEKVLLSFPTIMEGRLLELLRHPYSSCPTFPPSRTSSLRMNSRRRQLLFFFPNREERPLRPPGSLGVTRKFPILRQDRAPPPSFLA